MIECSDTKLRLDMTNSLAALSNNASQFSEISNTQKFNSFLLAFLLKNYLEVAIEYRDKCEHFFMLAEVLYDKSNQKDLEASKVDFSSSS